jgi:chitodextrinase
VLPQGRTYVYTVSAIDLAGNVGSAATVSILVPDTVPPGSAGPLTATATGPNSVSLAWVAASDNVGVTSYQLRRNGTVIGTTGARTFVDNAAPDGIALTYQVRALDGGGNLGPAASASLTLPDVTGPSLGGALGLTVANDGTINVSWPAATDNVAVSGYTLSRDGAPVATTPNTSYADAGLAQARTYQYSVTALDTAANASVPLTGSIYLPDVSAPSSPGMLTVVQSGPRAVDLRWGSATDNITIDHYVVSVDGLPVANTSATQQSGLVVSDGVRHVFSVSAVDGAGKVGPAAQASLTLPDVTAPSAAGSFSALATGASSVALSWSAATDNVGVTGYLLSRDGVRLAAVDSSIRGFTDTGATTNQAHTYTLIAIDAAGNRGATATAGATLVSTDVAPPSVPLDLRAVALSRRRISLSWGPSTDDQPGTLRYRVFRGRHRIATVTTTSYVDRPAVSGWYKYRVRAVDAAGNKSSFSVAVWVKAHA